ncbi:hypothetical protein GCM10023097_28090 [Streptomyces collinus]
MELVIPVRRAPGPEGVLQLMADPPGRPRGATSQKDRSFYLADNSSHGVLAPLVDSIEGPLAHPPRTEKALDAAHFAPAPERFLGGSAGPHPATVTHLTSSDTPTAPPS